MEVEDSSREYCRRHRLHYLVDELVQQVVKSKPQDPLSFMSEWCRKQHSAFVKGSLSTGSATLKTCSLEEVKKHSSQSDCWIIVSGKVYDVTSYLSEHPGGSQILLNNAGKDATTMFEGIHSPSAKEKIAEFYVADLEVAGDKQKPSTSSGSARRKTCSLEEVKKHSSQSDCWIIVSGKVYDVTSYLSEHPGGSQILLSNAGKDATTMFEGIHSPSAKEKIAEFYVADLEGAESKQEPSSQPDKGLAADQFREFPLIEVRPSSATAKIFRFEVPPVDRTPVFPVCSHISVRSEDGTARSYTPISTGPGYFELVVKLYPEGVISGLIHRLMINSKASICGPIPGKFTYKVNQYPQIGMLAGGTGLAPMLQVVHAILEDPKCTTKATLLLANRTEDDIILKGYLDGLVEDNPAKFAVFYLLDKPMNEQHPYRGHVSADLVRKLLPSPAPTMHNLICGPPAFNNACVEVLKAVGFTEGAWTIL
eukprot:RCo053069